MNKPEAISLVNAELCKYKDMQYQELVSLVGTQKVFNGSGISGCPYDIEIQFVWDDKQNQAIRVIGALSTKGFRAFFPFTQSFIMSANGSLCV